MKRMLLLLSALATLTAAQPPDTLWTRTAGGREWDIARWVEATWDGGCVVAGSSSSSPVQLCFRYDSVGGLLWQTSDHSSDLCYCVRQTPDSGFILVGSASRSAGCSLAVLIIRLDRDGELVWRRTYGRPGSWYSHGASVVVHPDGSFVIVGGEQAIAGGGESMLVMRISAGGELLQQNGYRYLWGEDIALAADGGCLAAATGWSDGPALAVRLDYQGDTLWTRALNGLSGTCVSRTADNGYVVGTDLPEACLTRLDSSGAVLWERSYGPGRFVSSAHETPDGGFVFAGREQLDLLLARTDSEGNLLWTTSLGGDSLDRAYGLCLTADSGYIAAGLTRSRGAGKDDFWVVRFDRDPTGVEERPGSGGMRAEPRLPTMMRAYDLASFDGRVLDAQGRDVSDRRSSFAPGVYFVCPGSTRAGRWVAAAKVIVGD